MSDSSTFHQSVYTLAVTSRAFVHPKAPRKLSLRAPKFNYKAQVWTAWKAANKPGPVSVTAGVHGDKCLVLFKEHADGSETSSPIVIPCQWTLPLLDFLNRSRVPSSP